MKRTFTILLCLMAISATAQVDLEQNLKAFYSFTGDANDESTNSNNGTSWGATLSNDRFGNSNAAYYFTTSSYIELPLLLNGTTDFTISLWIQSKLSPIGGVIFGNGDGNNNDGFEVVEKGSVICSAAGADANIIELSYRGGTCSAIGSAFKLTKDTWTHLCVIRSGANIKLYVNGALQATGSSEASTPTKNTLLGKPDPNVSRPSFTGDLDDIRVYDRAVTDEEVMALYGDMSTSSVGTVNIAAQVAIYPNPSTGIFTIELPQQGANLNLVNAQGVTVKQFNNYNETKLQITDLPKGMYILQTEIDGFTAYKKIIIQ